MRVRILQAFALVGLLHALTPAVDPAQVSLAEVDQHYGETVEVSGRVADVEPNGEVVRLTLVDEGEDVPVLVRGSPSPIGSTVRVRGQPSPGEAGPVIWAEGRLVREAGPVTEDRLAVDRLVQEAPRFAERPIAVVGTFSQDGPALVGGEGRLPVDPAGVEPEPGPALVWGRLVYEPARAGYELEATGWRAWNPSGP